MSVEYTATLSPCFGSGPFCRDGGQSGVTQHKADTDTLEQAQGLGCRERILLRWDFMHLERAMAWDTQTLMGRHRGQWTGKLNLPRTLLIPRVVQPQMFSSPVDTPWIQLH